MIDVAFAACPLALISCVQAPLPKMQVNFFVEDVSFRLPEDCSWPAAPVRGLSMQLTLVGEFRQRRSAFQHYRVFTHSANSRRCPWEKAATRAKDC